MIALSCSRVTHLDCRTVCAFTLERVFVVLWPLHAASTLSVGRTRRLLGLLAPCALLLNLPYLFAILHLDEQQQYCVPTKHAQVHAALVLLDVRRQRARVHSITACSHAT